MPQDETPPQAHPKRLSLRFADPTTEAAFQRHAEASAIPALRAAVALGALIYAGLAGLDAYAIPDATDFSVPYRLGVFGPACVLSLGLSYSPRTQRLFRPSILGLFVLAVVGVALMSAGTSGAMAPVYASGLMLVQAFIPVLRMKVGEAALAGTSVVVAFPAAMAWDGHPLSQPVIVTLMVFFLCFDLIAIGGCYWIWRSLRQEFLARLELERALANVQVLSGLLPLCAWCHQVRDDRGYWSQIESYVASHSAAQFSHSICPACEAKVQREDVPSGGR